MIAEVNGDKVYSKLKYEAGVHRVQVKRKGNMDCDEKTKNANVTVGGGTRREGYIRKKETALLIYLKCVDR